jgi:hypothetical protein
MSDIGTWTGVGVNPQVSSASVILDKVLRVEFDEEMENNADFIASSSYTITTLDPGSVAVSIVSLTPGAGNTFIDILVDKSFTNGVANYRVAVSNLLVDIAGNTLDPAADQDDFDGFGPRPIVEGVSVFSSSAILMSFSDAMKADAALTTPGNYVFTSSTGPAVTASVVDIISTTIIKITIGTFFGVGDAYTVVASGIRNLSENVLAANPFDRATFAWSPFTVEIGNPAEVLPLKKYDFLIKEIRDQDHQNGDLFVQRFLEGGQTVWADTVEKIFSLKNLWSVEDCPDDYLQFLKAIVGWTGPIAGFTKDLDAATLRRLISLSAGLWKKRGSETAIVDVMNILVPSRVLVWSWFDVRWMTDETAFDEMHQGRDPWLFSMPLVDPYYPEHWSIIRMVDPGVDIRPTVRSVVELMRPVGENFLIVYLLFLDLFEIDDDLSQWDISSAPLAIVDEGMLQLTDSASREIVLSNVTGSDLWVSSMIYARMRGTKALVADKGLRIDFLNKAGLGYCVYLDLYANRIVLASTNAFETTELDAFEFSSIPYELQESVWYGVRVHIAQEGADLRFKVYVGGTERIDYLEAAGSIVSGEGTAGFGHEVGVTMEVSDFEVMGLPVVSETIEIE